jgi:hypothetical protein
MSESTAGTANRANCAIAVVAENAQLLLPVQPACHCGLLQQQRHFTNFGCSRVMACMLGTPDAYNVLTPFSGSRCLHIVDRMF